MGLTIKKEDTVLVITGKENGKQGRVIKVIPEKGRVLVEKINMIKKHMKPGGQYKQGGIIEKEAPIRISNVMLICTHCGRATRIGNKSLENGGKIRMCRKCKEVIE
jgi:large subunit ribosomal protein L24